jgi:S-adenosylmethionine:tRNA ribosyltransferase-isomerase
MHALSDYNYLLPEEAIAQTPLEDRARARLLWLRKDGGACSHHQFFEVPALLEKGDLLVLNNTRVTALRLGGHKTTGGHVEALLLRETENPGEYVALMKPGKRLPVGAKVIFEGELKAFVVADQGEGQKLIQFKEIAKLKEQLREVGQMPLPPYIKSRIEDAERYQTVYASRGGSAAAPTAGLHFTDDILCSLREKGISTAFVTLDVGIDTFRPLQTEDLSQVQMHGEYCEIPEETAEAIAKCQGRVIAVGTTTVRTLESFAVGPREVKTGRKLTTLFITPGFQYQIIEGMFTNFHLPKTTMLLMISALAGREEVLKAYDLALQQGYRFLSFGDSMLIL